MCIGLSEQDVDRLSLALTLSVRWHAAQTRKSTGVPYVTHLWSVASLVGEHGGSTDWMIAALLHDAIEDQGVTAATISEHFGPSVAAIVVGCTDADTIPKPPWRARKEAYLAHLESADEAVLLVSGCDKLHNLRSLNADLATLLQNHASAVPGPVLDAYWQQFRGGRSGTFWYYESLSAVYARRLTGRLAVALAAEWERFRSYFDQLQP